MSAALATAAFLFAHAPTVRAQCGSDASAPPCPTPVNAFLSLDVTAGDVNTVITVTGGQFLPNEQTGLYWDSPDHVAGTATADQNGSFSNVKVKPYQGESPGLHRLCASVDPHPCATFTVNGPPSPTPSPSAQTSPSPSESPAPVVSDVPTTTPVAVSLSGFDVISRPPFVFLPLAGALGIALSLGYWVVSMMRRPRQKAIPTAAVVHRAMRPDYTAGFGTPPPTRAPQLEPSAWNEPVHEMPPQAPPEPTQPEAAAEPPAPEVDWGPPVEWGTGSGDWGFPEPPPDDNPEAPPPAD
ncbi:MAG TPA: hypothetical protein VFL27_04330 [Candidatus Dormibacteraeota bacterium]|nr:hypothetical protein [Candidatus Dormibacteraeota bacterium]